MLLIIYLLLGSLQSDFELNCLSQTHLQKCSRWQAEVKTAGFFEMRARRC